VPAVTSHAPAIERQKPVIASFSGPITLRGSIDEVVPLSQVQPKLTAEFLQAYVDRQQALRSFNHFDVVPEHKLTTEVLLGYIARQQNPALAAIDAASADQNTVSEDILAAYAADKFVPTIRKVKLADDERNCLTAAIYHEARGESEEGQWAVANVIINRAMSKKYPATLCGVVFQNADQGYHHCQFTFACDGKSDFGTEKGAWARATKMADAAYKEFKQGDTPGVIPKNALYYHTTSVNPGWSNKFRRVATIGAHEFYASN
jgi:spore germination cell wall hydrolase CwlJ-like protein